MDIRGRGTALAGGGLVIFFAVRHIYSMATSVHDGQEATTVFGQLDKAMLMIERWIASWPLYPQIGLTIFLVVVSSVLLLYAVFGKNLLLDFVAYRNSSRDKHWGARLDKANALSQQEISLGRLKILNLQAELNEKNAALKHQERFFSITKDTAKACRARELQFLAENSANTLRKYVSYAMSPERRQSEIRDYQKSSDLMSGFVRIDMGDATSEDPELQEWESAVLDAFHSQVRNRTIDAAIYTDGYCGTGWESEREHSAWLREIHRSKILIDEFEKLAVKMKAEYQKALIR